MENYEKRKADLAIQIPELKTLSLKTFEKEGELVELRVELRKLENEISAKIRETQMKALPADQIEETIESNLDHSENLRLVRLQSITPRDYQGEVLGM